MAYAVDPDGHRRLLAITLGPEESEDSWSELLEQLLERGLSGVELVIADEHAGLAAAVRRFLPEVRRQRCTVHLQRNVLAKVPHRLRKRVACEAAAVFRAPGLAEAKKRLAEITTRWQEELPEAMRVLERGFTAATQFYAFPEPHWARLRTTNSLERLHTEIKRRIRSAGAFPDRASALRLITAVALRTTAVWSERRYLDLTLLDASVRLPWRPPWARAGVRLLGDAQLPADQLHGFAAGQTDLCLPQCSDDLLRSVSLPSHPHLLAEKLQTRSILTLHLVSFQGVRSRTASVETQANNKRGRLP